MPLKGKPKQRHRRSTGGLCTIGIVILVTHQIALQFAASCVIVAKGVAAIVHDRDSLNIRIFASNDAALLCLSTGITSTLLAETAPFNQLAWKVPEYHGRTSATVCSS